MLLQLIHINADWYNTCIFQYQKLLFLALKIYIPFVLLYPEWAIISHLGEWSQPVKYKEHATRASRAKHG